MTVQNNDDNQDFLLLKTLNAFISKLQFSSQPETLLKQIPIDLLEILTVYSDFRFVNPELLSTLAAVKFGGTLFQRHI